MSVTATVQLLYIQRQCFIYSFPDDRIWMTVTYRENGDVYSVLLQRYLLIFLCVTMNTVLCSPWEDAAMRPGVCLSFRSLLLAGSALFATLSLACEDPPEARESLPNSVQ